jgi:hypothetical protein
MSSDDLTLYDGLEDSASALLKFMASSGNYGR